MNFLERVREEKRAEVAAARARCGEAGLLRTAREVPVRDFRAALAIGTSPRVIAELKLKTPTVAAFPGARSLLDLARLYEDNGAAAISIVTDRRNFGTSLDDVPAVRAAVSLPVVVKDFVIDRYQVIAARAAGADAILLIVRMLAAEALQSLLALARDLGMAALVETHDEREVAIAAHAGARLIGINNRDLDTMTVSLETTRRLAPLAPADTIVVSESGIRTRAEIDDLSAGGAHAFLVGGSLLSADDPAALLRDLTRTEQNRIEPA